MKSDQWPYLDQEMDRVEQNVKNSDGQTQNGQGYVHKNGHCHKKTTQNSLEVLYHWNFMYLEHTAKNCAITR